MTEPRYDPEQDLSRHSVASDSECKAIEDKYGWELVKIEDTGDPILPKDCVFRGKTEFPKPFNELAEEE
jgi:hypothetical protein